MSEIPLKLDYYENGLRPRDWQPKKPRFKIPLRLFRLCALGAILPALFVAGPIYLRYRIFTDQLYPVSISDQRLIDGRISTTWCQRQILKLNATFNAYVMDKYPEIKREISPISMTRHLVLEDDMKEYWGFYLLRGSSVTVSTCVRWPGASLTVIRGHKHLHECAFIGEDSSEELDELAEIAAEQANVQKADDNSGPINDPVIMKRIREGVRLLEETHNGTYSSEDLLDFISENTAEASQDLDARELKNVLAEILNKTTKNKNNKRRKVEKMPEQSVSSRHHYEGVFKDLANIVKPKNYPLTFADNGSNDLVEQPVKDSPVPSTLSSAEEFEKILNKMRAMGDKGKRILMKLAEEIGKNDTATIPLLGKLIKTEGDKIEKVDREKRDILLSSPSSDDWLEDAENDDAAIEVDMLTPDGIADDRGTVNETTMNDRSKSEFWSSFSSSEERLLECRGLILNLPLTPSRHCDRNHETKHQMASSANTMTYRIPIDGYYFFVLSSENEIQPNYLRVKFELLKTLYNTSDAAFRCTNTTNECSLPIKFFSSERTVLELPVSGNESHWNEEFVVISSCEPRTIIYLICVMSVPVLILLFAFY